ncbi:MAG: FliM/FliN family flagellar motor switch protein [Myxococcales bacterium]|nr:FliM/FliN family flagellar motor switch protein [Myxococcales bacterium]
MAQIRQPRPYPWSHLRRLDRRQRWAERSALKALGVPGAAAIASAQELLGATVELRAGHIEAVSHQHRGTLLEQRPHGPLVAATLSTDAGPNSVSALAFCSAHFAAAVVDRLLGGDGTLPYLPQAELDALSRGALGYLLARTLADGSSRLRLCEVVNQPRAVLERMVPGSSWLWPLTLVVEPRPSEASGRRLQGQVSLLWVLPEAPEAVSTADTTPRRPQLPPTHLRGLPLTLCAHAGHLTLTRDELETLSYGDVVIPERCRLQRRGLGFVGELELHAAGARRALLRCQLLPQSQLPDSQLRVLEVLGQATGSGRGRLLSHSPEADNSKGSPGDRKSEETSMGQSRSKEQTESEEHTKAGGAGRAEAIERSVQLAGDAPVELCIELSRFTLRLEELASIEAGEVLSSGRPIGERVTLRAGDQPLAHGELVDVDGEIGMRITEVLGAG